jgi:hypothetical protein
MYSLVNSILNFCALREGAKVETEIFASSLKVFIV